MRRDPVILKSNRYGLILNLDPDITFEELLNGVALKFKATGKFFKNATLALTFRGRSLTKEEEIQLVEVIVAYAKIQVLSIIDEDPETEELYKRAVMEGLLHKDEDDRHVYKGTLKHGETLETDGTIVILGDVNPGATVISKQNIIVLGCLMGTVHAGSAGNTDAFVAALTLLPYKISIADKTARSAIVKKNDDGDYPIDPKIAFIKDGHLTSRLITKETHKEIFECNAAAQV